MLDVTAASGSQVSTMSLRALDNRVLTFQLGPLENANIFTSHHVADHRRTASPVVVYFRLIDGVATVFRIEDAAWSHRYSSPHPSGS